MNQPNQGAPWRLRAATAADEPRMLAIHNQTAYRTQTPDEFPRFLEQKRKAGQVALEVLEDESGRVMGWGILFRQPWRHASARTVQVYVDPAVQGRGGGSLLYESFEAIARRMGVRELDTLIRDDLPAALQFAEHRGFRIHDHTFRSQLDLEQFDPAPFRQSVTAAEERGYRFITMADMPDLDQAKRRIYALDMACAQDEPGIDKEPCPPIDYAAYARDMFDPEVFDPAAVIIAVKDDEWAGFTGLQFPPGDDLAYIFFTGVRRAHRGRGLAQAMKLICAEVARRRHCRRIDTNNHESNGPMLAINRKFGFVPQTGIYVLRKAL